MSSWCFGSVSSSVRTPVNPLTESKISQENIPNEKEQQKTNKMSDKALNQKHATLWRKRSAPLIGRRSVDGDIMSTVPVKELPASSWAATCKEAKGPNQSPVNINSRHAAFDPSLNLNPLKLNYTLCRELEVYNSGYTVVTHLKYKPGDGGYRSDFTPRSVLEDGPLEAGHEYELSDFHFHWGRDNSRGSEHTVNLKAFPMELQITHWNSTLYDSYEDALGKPNGILIIGIFVQIGKEHGGLKVLTDSLQDIQYRGRHKQIVSTTFNPNCLLPDPMLRDYWTYSGSLTAPPCSDNVTWILFRYPLMLSHEQVEEFRRLKTFPKGESPYKGETGIMVDNFRPTQTLKDRIVRASFQ